MRMVDTPGSHRAVTRGSWTTEAGVPSNEEVTILKSPSAPSAVKRPPYLSGPQTRASSSRQPQSRSRDAGSLADQMDGLRLKEKHSQTAAPASSEPKKVRVRWSSKRNSYMYTVHGEEKKVDTHTHHKGSLWVKIKGERYLATETS
ncbi:MAG: hypothetical protein L6R35_003190 [Caloplaca aegaea]|nr:MAG: hypothetical protein L6R35_003190 [Caloplaca aegaea]